MPENRLLLRFCVVCFSSVAFVLGMQINAEYLDLFNTDRFYYSWFDGLYGISLFDQIFFQKIISTIRVTVKSPEPFPHLFVYIVANLNVFNTANLFFQTLNLAIIFSFALVIRTEKQYFKRQIILFIVMLCFSYYWLVLFQITHRLKISILFLIWSFLAQRQDKNKLSIFFLALSIGSHLSILVVMPMLAAFKHNRISTPVQSLTSVFVIFLIVYVPFWVYIFYSVDPEISSILSQLFKNKLFLFTELSGFQVFLLALVLLLFGIFFEKRSGKNLQLVTYLLLQVLFIFLGGTSRTLMMVYLILFIVMFMNPSKLKFDLSHMRYVTLLFMIFCTYDTLKFISLHTI